MGYVIVPLLSRPDVLWRLTKALSGCAGVSKQVKGERQVRGFGVTSERS